MLNSQVVTVFCIVEAEVLLLLKPSKALRRMVGNSLLEEAYAEHVLYKTFHSNHFYKMVFNLVTTSLCGLSN